MTAELVKMLATFDAKTQSSPKRLQRLLRSLGHRKLVTWMSDMCNEYERHRPQVVDAILLDRLKQELGHARVEGFAQTVKIPRR